MCIVCSQTFLIKISWKQRFYYYVEFTKPDLIPKFFMWNQFSSSGNFFKKTLLSRNFCHKCVKFPVRYAWNIFTCCENTLRNSGMEFTATICFLKNSVKSTCQRIVLSLTLWIDLTNYFLGDSAFLDFPQARNKTLLSLVRKLIF